MVAVNVKDEPIQVGLVPEVIAMATEGATTVPTAIVMPVLVAVVLLAHVEDGGIEISQVTTSPFAIVVDV